MDVNLYTATKDNLTFPAFNISATLDLMTGSSYISGLQFIIRGLTNHHEFNFDYFSREICHNYNLSAADTSWVEGVPSNVTYYMDCFKPLSPESEYEIEVIVVPIAKDYKKNAVKTIRTPSCSKHPEFSECSLTEKRKLIALAGDSLRRDLPNITHNLSPLHFHGDELVVVTDVFRLIKPGIYILKILPMPDDQTITTTVTRSHNFTVIGSPCHSGPCGNGNCTVVNVYQYNCTCDDGYSNKNSNDSCFRDESQSGRSFNNPTTVVILATVGAIVALILVLAICRFRKHHGSTSTSMRPPDGTEIERLITPTNERVLVIYPNDSDKYVCLVELMCRFLRLYGLDVRLNTWEQSHIKVNGLEQWLNDEFDKANTILLFITAGFRQKWAKELDPAQTKHRFFCYAKQHILRDIEQGVTCPRKGKYVCAYFPFSNEYEIPNELRSFGEPGVYKLPEKFEDLYMELLGQVKLLQQLISVFRKLKINYRTRFWERSYCKP
uniref:Uncharacterized protein LOC102809301 n=1 Tax=Saccoglossus kowalevskii TaxID=10224 RepID=A0ABM0MCN5_SACKO|nr:PREDICTED: uncharacterized protein LOC102809301 [Saccoglossus kowalevskii]